MYDCISDVRTYEIGIGDDSTAVAASKEESQPPNHVKEAAASFARFQRDVSDIPPPRLHETISWFDDTAYRFEQFESAYKEEY